MTAPLLSICIATRNRAEYLGRTLDTILAQCAGAAAADEVEVVVVDGASSDGTAEVVQARAAVRGCLRYWPQAVNSGIDGDFDKAVAVANGTYCWLFSDDDLPAPDAVAKVLAACRQDPVAIVVDAEVRSADLTQVLQERRLRFAGERRYAAGDDLAFFADCIDHLSFIGALVVRRQLWLARQRQPYYGTEFIHVGVLFQQPLAGSIIVLGEPLVLIRYGVGNWMQRSFEVWMVKWPTLIWSFDWIPADVRQAAKRRLPWRDLGAVLGYRAKGWYSRADYRRFIWPSTRSLRDRLAGAIALIPGALLNRVYLAYRTWRGRQGDMFSYDLARARAARVTANAAGGARS
jgi:glycosyltransferase involved in cell wall biosynthesis